MGQTARHGTTPFQPRQWPTVWTRPWQSTVNNNDGKGRTSWAVPRRQRSRSSTGKPARGVGCRAIAPTKLACAPAGATVNRLAPRFRRWEQPSPGQSDQPNGTCGAAFPRRVLRSRPDLPARSTAFVAGRPWAHPWVGSDILGENKRPAVNRPRAAACGEHSPKLVAKRISGAHRRKRRTDYERQPRCFPRFTRLQMKT